MGYARGRAYLYIYIHAETVKWQSTTWSSDSHCGEDGASSSRIDIYIYTYRYTCVSESVGERGRETTRRERASFAAFGPETDVDDEKDKRRARGRWSVPLARARMYLRGEIDCSGES